MSYHIKTVHQRETTCGIHGDAYCEDLACVESQLIWFAKHKAPCVATDKKGNIIGRVIEETEGIFRMWMEPI